MQSKQILAFSLGMMASISTMAQAVTIKCWINDDEVRECGNMVPPHYVPRGYQILSLEGVVLEEIPAQKTEEEIAKLKREEKSNKAKKDAEERKKRDDEALLKRYPTESDMRIALEGKLDSIKAAIQTNHDQIEYFEQDLEQTVNARENNIKEQETNKDARARKQIDIQNEALQRRINDIKAQILRFKGEIRKKHEEQAKAKADFDKELERYRQIKWR